MTLDTAVALAALALVLLWPLHQELTIRALRHAIRQQHKQLHQHRRAIVQLQSAAVRPPTSIGQPMPTVGRPLATGGVIPAATAYRLREGECDVFPPPRALRATLADRDPTLRLARPPAVSDIEHVLTQAGRALTATEMATQLGRQPWDLLPDIDRAMAAGRIRTVPGHTAGRTAYALVDGGTLRMARMPVLPGTVAR